MFDKDHCSPSNGGKHSCLPKIIFSENFKYIK